MMDFLLHIEQMLPTLLENYGLWIYAILFLIIFAETGSVFMFFLPGDSLLIAVGALCSTADNVHLHYMGILLIIAGGRLKQILRSDGLIAYIFSPVWRDIVKSKKTDTFKSCVECGAAAHAV